MISALQSLEQADVRSHVRQILWSEIGLLSTLSMEIAWLIPWIQVNIPGVRAAKTLHLFLLLAIFAILVMVVSRLMNTHSASPRIHQLALLVILVVASLWFLNLTAYAGLALRPRMIVSQTLSSFAEARGRIPSTLILLFGIMFVWWRGISGASKNALDYFSVRNRFRLGIAGLALFGLLNSSPNNRYLHEIIPIFFIGGLLAIALSRTHRLGQSRAAFHLPFTESWFLGIVLLTLGTLSLGLLGGKLLRTPLALEMAKFVGDFIIRGIQVFILIISPFFIWIPALATVLIKLLNNPDTNVPEAADPDARLGPSDLEIDLGQDGSLLELPPALVIMMVVLVLFLVASLIVRGAKARKRMQNPDFGDSGENILETRNLQKRLRALLDQAKEEIGFATRFGLGRRMLNATAIRWTYSQMLDFAARMGRQRKPHETPIEFQTQLHKLFPLHSDEIGLITAAYTNVRYGEFPEEDDIVALVRAAWVKMRSGARGKAT